MSTDKLYCIYTTINDGVDIAIEIIADWTICNKKIKEIGNRYKDEGDKEIDEEEMFWKNAWITELQTGITLPTRYYEIKECITKEQWNQIINNQI